MGSIRLYSLEVQRSDLGVRQAKANPQFSVYLYNIGHNA